MWLPYLGFSSAPVWTGPRFDDMIVASIDSSALSDEAPMTCNVLVLLPLSRTILDSLLGHEYIIIETQEYACYSDMDSGANLQMTAGTLVSESHGSLRVRYAAGMPWMQCRSLCWQCPNPLRSLVRQRWHPAANITIPS